MVMEPNKKVPTVAEYIDNNKKYAADLDQALAVAGFGWYNLKYSLVLALSLIAAIVEPLGYSYVLPASQCDLETTSAQRGFIASIPFIGIVLTSYPWGYLVDTQGRKRVAVYSSFAAGFFGILSAFMPELISFTVCKFIMALCIAGPAAVPYTFIGEILPQNYRDLTLSIVNAMQISGSAVVPLLAWGILPLEFNVSFGSYIFRSWRLLVIVNSVFFVISAFLLSFGPESPKFLVAKGKHDEALRVLQNIYAGNKGKSPEDYPVKTLLMPNIERKETKSFLSSLREQSIPILTPPFVKWLFLLGYLLFVTFATLNGLFVWVPDILNRVLTGTGNEGMTACQVIAQRLNETVSETAECDDSIETTTYIVNSIANSACAAIGLAASSTVKLIGKKVLLVIVFSIIGVFCILVNFMTQPMVFAVLLSSLPIMGITLGPINGSGSEIFPTHLRGMAISLAMLLGRLGSVIGANVASTLLNASCEATFYLFGGLLLSGGVLTFLLPSAKAVQPKTEEISTTRL